MTRQGTRQAAGRLTLAAVIISFGAVLVAVALDTGHDIGAIWFYLSEAVAALLLVIAAITFLTSFLVSG